MVDILNTIVNLQKKNCKLEMVVHYLLVVKLLLTQNIHVFLLKLSNIDSNFND